MSEIKATLSRLEAQKEQTTTLKRSLDEYDNLIRTQKDLNLHCHAFLPLILSLIQSQVLSLSTPS